jgi:hypothetical protein
VKNLHYGMDRVRPAAKCCLPMTQPGHNGRLSVRIVLAVGLLFGCGCAAPMSVVRDPGRLIGRPKPVDNVGRIVTLWESSSGSDMEGMPTRGFAGQIMFFNHEDSPVKVDGRVVIYEYDQYDEADEDPQPIHSFSFEPDAWNVHCSEGTLGHTYSVFIPYMKKHKDNVTCGLRVEFYCADGRMVSSDITSVMLVGKRSASTAALGRTPVISNRIAAKPVSSTGPVFEPPSDRLESVTIPLPRW